MTPMKSRMSRSSRLGAGLTVAPVSSTRAAAASAMDGAPGVDPDALARQDADERALLGDVEPADEIDGQVGAQERPRGRVGDEVGAEERAEEREGLHAHSHGIRQSGRRLLDHDVLRASRSEEHTSELQSLRHLVCRLLLEKKNSRVSNGGTVTIKQFLLAAGSAA